MPIGAITMILANVGLQIYNNWCGSRQNAALQQKREEFERAAKDRNTEHMWRLMREGQELTLQLENEKYADRLKELKDEVDHLLERLTYETTISNWPLKVLPIVMKNQAFGNLLANQEENVAMHVVFTRSNYDKFNKLVYPIIEKQLEQYCDKHWSTMTDHPILFYSGAWKPMVNPTDVQVTAMREELKNLPTLLITPFFRPNDGKLVFQLHMWGVGANSTDKFDVPEIEPTDFQRPFCNQDDYDNEEGLLKEIVEDLVPYFECMIGYMADTYFWSSAGLTPVLPRLLTDGSINTDGMRYLINDCKDYYCRLEDNLINSTMPWGEIYRLNLVIGIDYFDFKENGAEHLSQILLEHCRMGTDRIDFSLDEAITSVLWTLNDLPFIKKILDYASILKVDDSYDKLKEIESALQSINYDYQLLRSKDVDVIVEAADKGNPVAMYRLGELYEYAMGVDEDEKKAMSYYLQSSSCGFLLAEIKTGKKNYKDQPNWIMELLHSMGIIQVDLLCVESLLTTCMLSSEECKMLYKKITTPLITTGRLHSHTGLITDLALLMLKTGCDKSVPISMLQIASKLGYNKATKLLTKI